MKESTSFHIVGDSKANLCVCGGKSNTFKFKIKPLVLGRIDVTVSANTINNNDNVCKTNAIIVENALAADALAKKLLVEPEGIKKEFATSLFFCPKQYSNGKFVETMKLDIPKPFVSGSVFAELSVVGKYFKCKIFRFALEKDFSNLTIKSSNASSCPPALN